MRRTAVIQTVWDPSIFQSTHPLRGATKGEIFVVIHFHIISIHAPLAGCDRRTSARGPAHRPYFNPRTPCGVRPSCLTFVLPSTPYFNPRTPCGVRRANGTVNRSRAYFNPRTPCGVRHLHLQCMSWLEYFNPRTPCGVRLSIFSINKSLTNFNPRTPCGVRLIDVEKQVFEAIFQSTHPLRGATLKVLRGAVTKVISIHAPLAGCDERKIITHKEDMKFQSTHPLRGATERRRQQHHDPRYFNPRTPCGVRHQEAPVPASFLYFNPRTPCGVRRMSRCVCPADGDFNPRTPCGVRPGGDHAQEQRAHYFNPRTPCGVRHLRRIGQRHPVGISIHAPLAGCDSDNLTAERHALISIHAPLAGCDLRGQHGSMQRLAISIHAPLAGCDATVVSIPSRCISDFNPRTPCGVRRVPHHQPPTIGRFQSTHPLRGATGTVDLSTVEVEFQSTHPLRGATWHYQAHRIPRQDFNPRTPCGVRPT